MSRRRPRLVALAVVALTACAVALPSPGGAAPESRRLSPELFSKLSTGIALVRAFNCHGAWIDEGSGFLVGSSVVMTAGHVVRDACKNRIKVLLGGRWYGVARANYWFKRGQRQSAAEVDVSTLLLTQPSAGHLFIVSPSSAAKGENLSALGHPLGNDISLNQGHVVVKLTHDHVPLLAVRMLNAAGGSGSPLVDDEGDGAASSAPATVAVQTANSMSADAYRGPESASASTSSRTAASIGGADRSTSFMTSPMALTTPEMPHDRRRTSA